MRRFRPAAEEQRHLGDRERGEARLYTGTLRTGTVDVAERRSRVVRCEKHMFWVS